MSECVKRVWCVRIGIPATIIEPTHLGVVALGGVLPLVSALY